MLEIQYDILTLAIASRAFLLNKLIKTPIVPYFL